MPLQQVKSNRNSCMRLARRAIAFVVQIRDTMDGKWDSAPPSLKESVDRFESYAPCGSETVCDADRSYRLLLSIKDWMVDLAKTNLFTRVIKKDRIQDKLTDFEIQLTDTVSLFQVCYTTEVCDHNITMVPECRACWAPTQHEPLLSSVNFTGDRACQTSARYAFPDDGGLQEGLAPSRRGWGEFKNLAGRTFLMHLFLQFPLVHRSDLVLEGMTPMGSGWWQNLAEARINGRQVLVKRYDGREGRKACVSRAPV